MQAVERDHGIGVGARGGHEGDPPAAAETDHRHLAGRKRLAAQPAQRGGDIVARAIEIERLEPLPGRRMLRVVVGQRLGVMGAPEHVGHQHRMAVAREFGGDVADRGVEAEHVVHQHDAGLPGRRQPRQMGVKVAPAFRRQRQRGGLDHAGLVHMCRAV